MFDKQQRIAKEKRTIEATKKGLMGSTGKLGCILKNLGDPIIANSSTGLHDINYFDSGEEEFDLNDCTTNEEMASNLPTMEMWQGDHRIVDPSEVQDGWITKNNMVPGGHCSIGWIFDGLGQGMHLELKYMEDAKELTVYYKGHSVYKEVTGELMSYVPYDEWENYIETLYAVAIKKKKIAEAKDQEELKEEVDKNKQTWLQKFKDNWGI